MRKLSLLLIILFAITQLNAQELDCTVIINHNKIAASNEQIFETLKNSIAEFVNNRKWTNKQYKFSERIKCNMIITLAEYNNDIFTGNIQVQSSRPIYNSTYESPILNFKDKNFQFKYVEFEPLIYSKNSFTSNLVSILSFYSYMIIAMDADTFELNGGTADYANAQNITNLAQQSGYKGWNQVDGTNTRFTLIDDLLSPAFANFRKALYTYHLKGLDTISKEETNAKEQIYKSLTHLSTVSRLRPNAFLLRIFMDAKSDEISEIFSGGKPFDKSKKVKNILQKISLINSTKWDKIK